MLPHRLTKPGPLLEYLGELQRHPDRKLAAKADTTINAIRRLLQTDDGAILLDLLDKSVVYFAMDTLSDDRALAARNAQSLIAHDLRRIMSNETDQLRENLSRNAGSGG